MCRCAEKLVMGEGNVTTAGASDLEHVNNIAREMVYRCGFSKRLGPVSLMDNEDVYINKEQSRSIANISTELAAIALTEVEEVRPHPIACAFSCAITPMHACPPLAAPHPLCSRPHCAVTLCIAA